MLQKLLFTSSLSPLRSLTNLAELVKVCPKKFQRDNVWSNYAMKFFYDGGNTKNWQWKSNNQKIKDKQFICFLGLLMTFGLQDKDKKAVAGWMLSEMLIEIPKYIAPDESSLD